MADALVLGASVARRKSSSLFSRRIFVSGESRFSFWIVYRHGTPILDLEFQYFAEDSVAKETKMSYVHKTVNTPVGNLKLIASENGLAAILWENDKPTRVRLDRGVEDESNPVLLKAEKQLLEYFSGKRQTFSVPLDFVGTDFQKSVWAALLTIPFGETRSYGDIARQIGKEKAVRAVGAANGKNPISIIAPCHRVIGSSGELTGFAGGLAAKALLLNLEKVQKSAPSPQGCLVPR
jgi:methylated-DNA-[protein]-cysteine S-methyltransferase